MKKRLVGFLLVWVFCFSSAAQVLADSDGVPLEQQPPLPAGTVITAQNWQQYKDYMPLYMQILFGGDYSFKLAPDQQVVVGAPVNKPLPREYEKNTEKYSGQVGLKVLADSGTVIQNYTAGVPFPHPSNPNVADKILWNLWYRYLPRVEINKVINQLLVDKYRQKFAQVLFNDYMRLAHVSEPGLPIYTPEAKDVDIALYLEITEPEQSKYTVSLIIYFTDPTRIQEIWSFVPSLRRPLRLSSSARCAPAVGSDSTTEDQKSGFNLLLSESYGTFDAHKMILASNSLNVPYPTPIDFSDANTLKIWGVDQGVAWPPAPAKWELADTYIVEARRVKEKLPGYCYGNRLMYVDAQDYHLPGQVMYDMGNKLWKVEMLFSRLHPNGYGDQYETGSGNYVSQVIDLQNEHASISEELNDHSSLANTDVDPAYWSVSRYGSPTGLLEIMK